MGYITPIDRNQVTFTSLEDTIQANNPVRLIDFIIEKIAKDNKGIFFNNEKSTTERNSVGRPEYPPKELMKLLYYGYFNGINSSRKLEIETHRNKEVQWLVGSLTPDHWTISMFRKDNGETIKKVTRMFRQFLLKNEYIKAKTVALDGTKVRANTTRDFLTEESIEKIEKRLNEKMEKGMEEYMQKLDAIDNADETIEERERQLKKLEEDINKLKEKLSEYNQLKETMEERGKNKISKSDTESNYMRSRDGFIPAYNVQIISDLESNMIITSEVTDRANDILELEPMVQAMEEEIERKPEEILADCGYNNPEMINRITEEKKIPCYIPNVPEQRGSEEIKFEYKEEGNYVECSEGKRLELVSKNRTKNKSKVNTYQCKECEGCKMREKCTKSKKGRIYSIYLNQEWRDAYRKKMDTEEAKEKFKVRRRIEHIMGNIKSHLWRKQLLLRGKTKASIEIDLITTVYNMKRLITIEAEKGLSYLIGRINAYQWEIC